VFPSHHHHTTISAFQGLQADSDSMHTCWQLPRAQGNMQWVSAALRRLVCAEKHLPRLLDAIVGESTHGCMQGNLGTKKTQSQ
jgi:hypothetical protein